MKPASPVIPGVDLEEVVYANDQPQYQPLPCFKCLDGKILTRWTLSEEEKRLVLEQGYIYLAVSTFNEPLQPVYLSARPPDVVEYCDWSEAAERTADLAKPFAMVASTAPNPEDRETTEARGQC